MGYREVERRAFLIALDHNNPEAEPFPVIVDSEPSILPLRDFLEQLENAGVDIELFLRNLDAIV
jgi:hypothetical protein